MNAKENKNYADIPQELFVPAQVDLGERERISRPSLTAWQDGWLRLKQNKAAVVSLFIIIVIVALALLAPIFSPYDFAQTDYSAIYQPPSAAHLFGTDGFGRDQFTRIWYGTRISLLIGFVAACLDLFVGVTYGAVSALMGGKVDAIMQRIIEVLVGIPHLIIVILLMMVLPAGVGTIIVALAITGWVNMARLVRARILQLKGQEFVMAAQVLGTSQKNIILRHLIPNTVGVIVINAMFTIPSAIFTEAFLSFIGIGLSEPKASLGVLINNGYSVLQNSPYLLICPAIVIVLIMVCFSILGDGLRDALDPRMSK
ncbi:ABC transporter permease [Flavonifractor sp. AGMB03687]|uniref:ABC transporter permease n=1 Tax=Flavonifractor sp. AGMB03687 TaxID=2785133 RepID=UPI001AE07FEC|nr:ABC transporter permease [Flavonifractor sp. AGMB03687]